MTCITAVVKDKTYLNTKISCGNITMQYVCTKVNLCRNSKRLEMHYYVHYTSYKNFRKNYTSYRTTAKTRGAWQSQT